MREFFIAVTKENSDGEVGKEELASYGAKFDVWSSMAYFVARELHLRPYEVLTTWTCEELLVAYGEYANIHSAEAYETRMSLFRKNEKPKKPTPDEKWAVVFLTNEELKQLNEKHPDSERVNLAEIAQNLFF